MMQKWEGLGRERELHHKQQMVQKFLHTILATTSVTATPSIVVAAAAAARETSTDIASAGAVGPQQRNTPKDFLHFSS